MRGCINKTEMFDADMFVSDNSASHTLFLKVQHLPKRPPLDIFNALRNYSKLALRETLDLGGASADNTSRHTHMRGCPPQKVLIEQSSLG